MKYYYKLSDFFGLVEAMDEYKEQFNDAVADHLYF